MDTSNAKKDATVIWIDIDECASYLKTTTKAIYNLVHRRVLPHYKFGSRLFFLKSEIDAVITRGRIEERIE